MQTGAGGFPEKHHKMGIPSMMNIINIAQTCETDFLCFASVFTGLNIQQKSHITKRKEISSGDIKLFITHIIAMGLMRKSNMEKYWS